MKNGIAEIIKVNKFTSVDFVCVTYRMGNGEVRVSSGKTEAEAMANIDLTPKKLVTSLFFGSVATVVVTL